MHRRESAATHPQKHSSLSFNITPEQLNSAIEHFVPQFFAYGGTKSNIAFSRLAEMEYEQKFSVVEKAEIIRELMKDEELAGMVGFTLLEILSVPEERLSDPRKARQERSDKLRGLAEAAYGRGCKKPVAHEPHGPMVDELLEDTIDNVSMADELNGALPHAEASMMAVWVFAAQCWKAGALART